MEDEKLSNISTYLNDKEIYTVINKTIFNDNNNEYKCNSKHLDEIINDIKKEKLKYKDNNSFNIQKNKINVTLFNKIRDIAISKGGFLNNYYRKYIYAYIFNIDIDNEIEYNNNYNNINIKNNLDFLKINYNENINLNNTLSLSKSSNINSVKIESNKNNIIKDHKNLQEETGNNYYSIIKVDTYRSKINYLLDSKFSHTTNLLIKQKLHRLVSNITDILDNRYHYFQGFHDLLLLFLLLFQDDLITIKFIQIFCEFYIREGMNSKDDHNNFNFMHEMQLISKYVKLYDNNLGNEINSCFEEGYFFVTSWLITFFSHNMNDISKQYRILDYILVSNPSTIYCLSSTIIVEEYKLIKLNYNYKYNEHVSIDILFKNFQNIDYNNYNYDESFIKCEKFKKRLKKLNFNPYDLLDRVLEPLYK